MDNPTKPGKYLLLAREWVGLEDQRPEKPEWSIRRFEKGQWQTAKYYFDTGGYENFEPVRWQELPPVNEPTEGRGL